MAEHGIHLRVGVEEERKSKGKKDVLLLRAGDQNCRANENQNGKTVANVAKETRPKKIQTAEKEAEHTQASIQTGRTKLGFDEKMAKLDKRTFFFS